MKTNRTKVAHLLAVVFSGGVTAAIAQTVTGSGAGGEVNATTASVLGTAVAGLVYAGLQLRKRLSRDNVDMKADSYVQQALEQSQKNEALARDERNRAMDEARSAWSSKNADATLIGELRTENRMLKEQLSAMQQQVLAIRRGVQSVGQNVDTLKNSVEETQQRVTGNAPLGDN